MARPLPPDASQVAGLDFSKIPGDVKQEILAKIEEDREVRVFKRKCTIYWRDRQLADYFKRARVAKLKSKAEELKKERQRLSLKIKRLNEEASRKGKMVWAKDKFAIRTSYDKLEQRRMTVGRKLIANYLLKLATSSERERSNEIQEERKRCVGGDD